MNYWAQMLRELPAGWQRLIARSQRISMPRKVSAEERAARLRQALCHAETVRTMYLSLEPEAQAAIQHLRSRRGGIREAELEQRYGTLRSARQISADLQPRTISERLALLGWLMYRPATPRHPAHYLVPPEVRRWLPAPLTIPTAGAAPAVGMPVALRVAAVLLLACSERPLELQASGRLRRTGRRLLAQRLSPMTEDTVNDVTAFLLPVMSELGLVADHRATCKTTIAGHRFLSLSPDEQLLRLRRAWANMPLPDAWLSPLLIDSTGIDWPLLRRRLCGWAAALPEDRLIDPAALYPALAAAFGPLADAHTHGFRRVDRAPWQPRRAALVLDAALRGPLNWLGFVAWSADPGCSAAQRPVDGREPTAYVFRPASLCASKTPAWQYGAPGEVIIPHECLDADVLRLLKFGSWHSADQIAATYRVTSVGVARAQADGYAVAALRDLLADKAGSAPSGWDKGLDKPSTQVSIEHTAIVFSEPPAVLDRAMRARSVQRHVKRLAPGIGIVQPDHVPRLARALAAQGIAAAQSGPAKAAPPSDLTQSECAALLTACAFYRIHALPNTPLLPHDTLEQRLRGALPPRLKAAVEDAIQNITTRAAPDAPPSRAQPATAEPPSLPIKDPLPILRKAIAARRMISITYNTAERGRWTQRAVRPLLLEQRGDGWYLAAYCTARQSERTFRVDRIGSVSFT